MVLGKLIPEFTVGIIQFPVVFISSHLMTRRNLDDSVLIDIIKNSCGVVYKIRTIPFENLRDCSLSF